MMANMDILRASEQQRRVGLKMMLASQEDMEAAMKRFEKIAKDNPEALEELNKAMEEQRKKDQQSPAK